MVSRVDAADLCRSLLAFAHTVVELRVDSWSTEQFFESQPGSGVVSAAAIYAHTVLGEDHFVSNHSGETLLYSSGGWATRLGFEPLAEIRLAWAEALRYDSDTMRIYAEAVYARSDRFLAGVSEADAARPVENWEVIREDGKVRYAKREMPFLFGLMDNVTLHTVEHAGEIAILNNLGRQG